MLINPGNAIRVVIVDDHGIFRAGLRMLINSQSDMQVVGEAATISKIASVVTEMKPHVVLLDVGMPGGSGLQVLKQLQSQSERVRAIILTMHNDAALLRFALSAGAAGFVLKQAADQVLISAIRATYNGGVFIDPTLVGGVVPPSSRSQIAGEKYPLSDRQQQVLCSLAQGYGNQEIARRLHVSVKTVETYRSRISEKLGLRTRAEITRYALSTGLLKAEDVLKL